jgi:hypothetical protein
VRGSTQLRLSSTPAVTTLAAHPMATLLSLLADGVGIRPQGLPPQWRAAVRSALPAGAHQLVEPMFHPASASFPDSLAAATGAGFGRPAEEQIEWVADTAAKTLLAELEADHHGQIPPLWRPVAAAPKQWIGRYVAMLRSLWAEFRPVWRQAEPWLQREAERVGSAVVTGTLPTVLSRLNPRFRYADGVLYLPDLQPAMFTQDNRPLTLVPLVSGLSASVFNAESADRVWIGYPLPGLGRLWSDEPAPPKPGDPLLPLLGAARASILRGLVHPEPMSGVARLAGCSPATATYHCQQLEAAGLVSRQRVGNQVQVRRTTRGDALVDLLS